MSRRKLTPTEIDVILTRQNRKCAVADCGSRLIAGQYHADHEQPLSRGGKDDISNLQFLCIPHHREKTFGKNGNTRGSDLYEAAKTKRLKAKFEGTYIRTSPKMQSRGFEKRRDP